MNCEYSGNVPLFNEFSSLNSILMASLYSENSRDLIIKKAKSWDNSNKYKSLIKKIVNKNKRKIDISDEISLLKPDEIFLENMYFLKNTDNKKKFALSINKLNLKNIKWIDDFIIDFYRGLGLNCLDIYIYEDIYYLNIYNNINWLLSVEDIYTTEINDINQSISISDSPDILIVYSDKLNTSIGKKYISPFITKKTKNIKLDDFKNRKFNNFTEIVEDINIDGNIYILDSILIKYKDKSIVCFRCNGEKYVYNNFSNTYDSPCSIIKFDWKYDNGNFCYNPFKCNLEDEILDDIENLCFDLNKGDKTLIYIKKDNIEKIPDIPDEYILEIIKKIKNYNIAELTEIIKKYDTNIIEKQFSKEELEKIVFKLFLIYYKKIEDNPSIEQETEPPKE